MTESQSRAAATLELLSDLIRRARAAGADQADAIAFESVSYGASFRMGKPEDIERSETVDLGLRVLIGKRQSFVAGTDRRSEALDKVVERAVAMAKLAPEDKFCGLADPALLAKSWPDLDLADPAPQPSIETLIDEARLMEEAALAVPGITNSEGGGASAGSGLVALATSDGFAGAFFGTNYSRSVSVIAGEGTGMERDYDFSSKRFRAELADPATIGRNAADKALARLNPRKVASQTATVVYDPRVSGSLVGHLSGAINGQSVARGTSFLKDRMGEQIFRPGINIVDDPLRIRGARSRPFDGEGVATRRRVLVADGRLDGWLLDTATGLQLGLATQGNASRGAGGPPGPSVTNLYLEAGEVAPEDLIADIKSGLYITELIGMGVNGVTGDYSRGASGFWIENGKIAYPVSELTIAGNLKDMFARMIPASDLTFRYGTDAPTIRIDDMMIAGT